MPLSGFPEWLPPQRIIEQQVIDRIRGTFELYGFAPLETRSVEPLDTLLSKGETSNDTQPSSPSVRAKTGCNNSAARVRSASASSKNRSSADCVDNAFREVSAS